MYPIKGIFSLILFLVLSLEARCFLSDSTKSKASGQQVGSISQESIHSLLKRREPLKLYGFYLGPNWLMSHTPSSRDSYSFSFSGHREVLEQAEINYRFTGGMSSKLSGGSLSLTMGAIYLPLKSDVSPYLGFDFGLGFMSFLHEKVRQSPFGFIGGLRSGARFFRTSKNQLDLSLGYGFLFRRVVGQMPSYFSIKLGLLL